MTLHIWAAESLGEECVGVSKGDINLGLQEERNANQLLDGEDKPEFEPQGFDSLRKVALSVPFLFALQPCI